VERTPDRPIRVVQWTTGNVARQSIAAIVERPDLELVGVYAHSQQKAGRDVGELAGLGRTLGILAATTSRRSSRSRPTASSTCRCIPTWGT
jgi:2,4-diaminopentanoate dehydrogenase